MKTLLISGTDTNVGKTWVSCLILRDLKRQAIAAGAYKPVCSGMERDGEVPFWDDVEQLATAIAWTGDRDQICPQRFEAAVAPNVAATLEGRCVDDALLKNGLDLWANSATHVVVESAGGLLCPLSDQTSVADLAEVFHCPILIVAANRLGVINHTLLTVEVAERRGLRIAGVVLNDCHSSSSGDASCDSNQRQLQHLLPQTPLYRCHHGNDQLQSVSGTEPNSSTMFFE